MWPVFPAEQTLLVIGAALFLFVFAMRIVQPAWWSSRAARVGLFVAFAGALIGIGVWSIGHGIDHVAMVYWGAGLTYVATLTLLPAAIAMPFAAALNRILVRVATRKEHALVGAAPVPVPVSALAMSAANKDQGKSGEDAPPPSSSSSTTTTTTKNASAWRQTLSATRMKVSRRALIHFGTASIPAMAAVTGASGFAQARRDPTMPVIRLRYPGLHPDLEGLKILHLSDLHLGACLGLEDLKRGLALAREAHRPDLIVLTGDLADDPMLIPGALDLVAAENARYGALASLGNHEYLHNIEVTRPKYEAGPFPLLVSSGRTLRVGRASLFVGGADDPVHMSGEIAKLLTPSIEAAAAMAPRGGADFRLLLCHRPEGFGPANENGFDLTLSGHTHGGQIGMFGRSLLEKIRPGIGWWGSYSKKRPPEIQKERARAIGCGGPSRLYTTSGFGHWFPFRVGCPTEMPIIVLSSSDGRSKSESDQA